MTSNQPQIDETIVRIRPDKIASQALLREVGRIKSAISGVGVEGDRAIDKKLGNAAKSAKRDVDRLNDSLKQTKLSAAQAADVQFGEVSRGVGLFGDVQSNLGALSALTGNRNIAIAGEFAALAEELPRLKTAVAGLPAQAKAAVEALGGVGGVGLIAALGALTAAFALSAQQFNQNKQAAIEGLDAESRLQLLRTSGTQAEIDEARDAAQARRREAIAGIAAAEADIERIRNSLSEDEFARTKIRAQLGVSDDPNAAALSAAADQIDRLGPIAETATLELIDLENLMNEAGITTRLAADAERELADARQRASEQALDDQIRVLLGADRFKTTRDLDKYIDGLEEERDLREKGLATLDESSAKFVEYSNRIQQINSEISTLNLAVRDEVEAREREANAIDRAKFLLKEATKAREEELKKIEAAKQIDDKIADLTQSLTDKVAKINADLSEKLLKAEETRSDALTEARLDAADTESEAQRSANLDRQKQQAQHAKEIERIQRQLLLDENAFVQDRNAIALDEAQTRAKEETKQAQENNEERLSEIDDSLKEQNRLIDKRLADQTRTIQKRYDQQVRDAQTAAVASINLERQRITAEINQKIQEKNTLLGLEQQAGNNEIALRAQRNAALLQLEQQFVQGQLNLYLQRNAQQQIPAANVRHVTTDPTPNPSLYGRSIPVLNTGGRILSDGLAYLHAGEMVINPRRGQGMGGNLTINIEGATRETINATSRQQALATFERVLDSMGVA